MSSLGALEKDNNDGSLPGAFLRKDQVLGKTVIGLDARTVGTVQDLAISTDGKVVVEIKRPMSSTANSFKNGDHLFVSPEEVLAVGDVVLLRHSSALAGKRASIPASSSQMSSTPVQVGSSPPTLVPSSSYSYSGAQNYSANQRICGRCNFLNSANAKFCIKCGSQLS
jgi:sporulation protein YlmC with PRC-barrel domain/ribosomal protein L40E